MISSNVPVLALTMCAFVVGPGARSGTPESTTLDVVVSEKGSTEARFVSSSGSSIGVAETFLDKKGTCPSKSGSAKIHVAPRTPYKFFISVVARLEDCPVYPITVESGSGAEFLFHRHTVEEAARLEKQASGFDIRQRQDHMTQSRYPVLVVVTQNGIFVGTQNLNYLKQVTLQSIGGTIGEARAELFSFRTPMIFMHCENDVPMEQFLGVASAIVGDGYNDLEFVAG